MDFFSNLFPLTTRGTAEHRYYKLKRNIFVVMVLVTIIPLLLMAFINSIQYKNSLKQEKVNQMLAMVHKAEHSIQLFLQERSSAVKYIANAYSYEHINEQTNLREIFFAMQQNFSGFIDLGLINDDGVQINYVGPYDLEDKDYTNHDFYHEARIKGTYISDVFLGYRRFPHIVIAVERRHPHEKRWIIRSSIDIDNINRVIAAMGLASDSDAFLLSRDGIIQTPSKMFGNVLDKWPLEKLPVSFHPTVMEAKDLKDNDVLMTYVYIPKLEFVLVVAEPLSIFYKSWYALKWQTLIILAASLVIIISIIYKMTDITVKRIRLADERRESAFRELEHSQKLSSIGRMAAGVAHEINNPLAIINEKTGLMMDIMQNMDDFSYKEKFLGISESITHSVERARSITYRLLGFARRLESKFEKLDLNSILKDVIGFLEKEAIDRSVDIRLHLKKELSLILSDRGQLEQVFLNIITNALVAVDDGGQITISTRQKAIDSVEVSIKDNGCGMTRATLDHIFEPFFTTKKNYGTGLGLSITHGIVSKLGGKLYVNSKEGEGTTFYVSLPVNTKFPGDE